MRSHRRGWVLRSDPTLEVKPFKVVSHSAPFEGLGSVKTNMRDPFRPKSYLCKENPMLHFSHLFRFSIKD